MRTFALAITVVLLTVTLPGCLQDPGPGTNEAIRDGFERGIHGWTKKADVPQDPNRPGQAVDWNINSSDEIAREGEWSVLFELDGSQDDGTIWLERPFQVEGDQAYEMNVTLWAHSLNESFNERAHLVMYTGHEAPTEEGDFPSPGQRTNASTSQEPGGLRLPLDRAEGWSPYSFEWTISPAEEREDRALYVAFGISAVWETELSFHLDELEITLTRLP